MLESDVRKLARPPRASFRIFISESGVDHFARDAPTVSRGEFREGAGQQTLRLRSGQPQEIVGLESIGLRQTVR